MPTNINPGGNLPVALSLPTYKRWHRAVGYVEAMMRAPIPGGSNHPVDGPRFPLNPQRAETRVARPAAAEEEAPPEFYGQVRMAVANLTWGASLLPLVNVVP